MIWVEKNFINIVFVTSSVVGGILFFKDLSLTVASLF